MKAAWRWWVDRAVRPVDTRPYALMRIALALVVLVDHLRFWHLGLADRAYRLFEDGGLAGFHRDQYWFLDSGPEAGIVAFWVFLASMACVALGVFTRPAMLVGVLAYAQLGHLFPTGDRGVDRLVRTLFLLLICTNAHRCYSLGNLLRRRPRLATTPGWVQDLVHLLLALVYMAAGFAKVGSSGWFGLDGTPMLYRILADPLAGRLDPRADHWRPLFPLFRAAGWVTVVWEVCAPVFLTRVARWWGLVGICLHVGIALTMKLGMFSYGMLSIYFVVMAPFLLPALDRLERRLGTLEGPAAADGGRAVG